MNLFEEKEISGFNKNSNKKENCIEDINSEML